MKSFNLKCNTDTKSVKQNRNKTRCNFSSEFIFKELKLNINSERQ